MEIIHLLGRLAVLRAYTVLAANGDIAASAYIDPDVMKERMQPYLLKAAEAIDDIADRGTFWEASLVEIRCLNDAMTVRNEARARHLKEDQGATP